MKIDGLLQGAIICTLLFFAYSQNTETKKPRRKRCHCKKYVEKINRDVNQRLKEFEDRFEKYMAQYNNHREISNDLRGDLSKTMVMDSKLESLNENMNETKEALRRESYNLRVVQENLYSQEVTLENLNTNFKSLEGIVKSLSAVVERLEETMRSGVKAQSPEAMMSDRTSNSQGCITLPPKTYPKGKQFYPFVQNP